VIISMLFAVVPMPVGFVSLIIIYISVFLIIFLNLVIFNIGAEVISQIVFSVSEISSRPKLGKQDVIPLKSDGYLIWITPFYGIGF